MSSGDTLRALSPCSCLVLSQKLRLGSKAPGCLARQRPPPPAPASRCFPTDDGACPARASCAGCALGHAWSLFYELVCGRPRGGANLLGACAPARGPVLSCPCSSPARSFCFWLLRYRLCSLGPENIMAKQLWVGLGRVKIESTELLAVLTVKGSHVC